MVVPLDEGADDRASLGESLEAMQPDALFIQRPDEALEDAVALRLADERVAVRDPQPRELAAEGVRDLLRSPIAPHRDAARDVLRECPEGQARARANGLQRRPSDRRSSRRAVSSWMYHQVYMDAGTIWIGASLNQSAIDDWFREMFSNGRKP